MSDLMGSLVSIKTLGIDLTRACLDENINQAVIACLKRVACPGSVQILASRADIHGELINKQEHERLAAHLQAYVASSLNDTKRMLTEYSDLVIWP